MSTKIKETREQKVISRSDKRIVKALLVLEAHERGLYALADFRRLCKGKASGLDSEGLAALQSLLKEFAGGRRDFLDKIHTTAEVEAAKYE